MYSTVDQRYNQFHYYCKKCGHDRGILNHSQYSTICPDCGGRYTVEPVNWPSSQEIDRRLSKIKH